MAASALSLRAAYMDGRIRVSVPSLLAYEVLNALRFKAELSVAQLEGAIESLFDMGLDWVVPTPVSLRRAAVLARQFDVTAYDATFAAVAEGLGAVFVTADAKLALQLAGLPFVRSLSAVEGD